MDFRDQIVKEALDKAVGPYRPEKSLGARVKRIATIALLALLACLGFASVLYYATQRSAPPASGRKPIPVEILPPRPSR